VESGFFTAGNLLGREGVDMELGDAVAAADKSQELPLGWLQRGIMLNSPI
jgi:hypothetical protein